MAEGSGGSSSSGSLPHSFSVDEIQKVNSFVLSKLFYVLHYCSFRFFHTVGKEFFNFKNRNVFINGVQYRSWHTVVGALLDLPA